MSKIIKDTNIYSLSLTISRNFYGQYLSKRKMLKIITDEFQNIIKTSKRTPKNLHTDRGSEYYNKIFNALLKLNNINHYSTYDEKRKCYFRKE